MGPGDPAAHRTNRLPLLPSGPGGVHRVLLHRARPRYSYDIYPIPSIREAMVEQTLMADEGWHSKSRSRAPTEGARPLMSPHAGEYLPRDPPRSNPPRPFAMAIPTHTPSQPCRALFDGGEGGIRTHGPVAETHAFQACRFVHSRTSPRSDDFKGWHLITQVLGRQGKVEPGPSDRFRWRGATTHRSSAARGLVSPPLTPRARISIMRDYFRGGA